MKKPDKVETPEDAATIIKQYEDIIRTKKKRYHICSVSSRKSV